MRRHAAAVLISFAAGLSMAGIHVQPVAAECTFIPPWPRITPAVRSAREIVVGEVVTDFSQSDLRLANDQAPRAYALLVTDVLRGDGRRGDLLDVQYLLPNWPYSMSAGGGEPYASCTYLLADPGEIIAVAFDALHPGGPMQDGDQEWTQAPTRYTAMGVIEAGPRADEDTWRERERVTLRQLRGLASAPSTDTTDRVSGRSNESGLVLLVGVLAFALVLRRFRSDRGDSAG